MEFMRERFHESQMQGRISGSEEARVTSRNTTRKQSKLS
jgi:hypothetical protein